MQNLLPEFVVNYVFCNADKKFLKFLKNWLPIGNHPFRIQTRIKHASALISKTLAIFKPIVLKGSNGQTRKYF
jgi:hypothetical protein